MKPVSLKAQKIIQYIPILNMSILGIWLYNTLVLRIPNRIVWRSYPIIFGISIPLSLLNIIFCDLFPAAATSLAFLFHYLVGFLLCRGLIRFQEKIGPGT